MTSYENMYNKKPFLDHLKVLGCLFYAKSINELEKLMARYWKAIHMGYSEIKKGYILYGLTNKTFFINRDVFSREDTFPFISDWT